MMIKFTKNRGSGAPDIGRFITVVTNVNYTGPNSYIVVLKSPFKFLKEVEPDPFKPLTFEEDVPKSAIHQNVYSWAISKAEGKWKSYHSKVAKEV